MINLLPQKNKKRLMRQYYIRFGILLLSGMSVALFIGNVLLVPSFFSAQNTALSVERYRDALKGTVGLQEGTNATTLLSELKERVTILNSYHTDTVMADFFDVFNERITGGIAVSYISLVHKNDEVTVALKGSANTRQNLLVFVESLRESPRLSGVTLPVSQLVSESNTEFSLEMRYKK
ncbi:MAG: hypothetical protein ACJKTH_00715 [Patescibacteria group bacterium UBA2163]